MEHLTETQVQQLNRGIKEWYTEAHAMDKTGAEELKYGITFNNLLDILQLEETNENILKAITGIDDSLVRERIFTYLAEVLEVDYSVIYDLWLYGGKIEVERIKIAQTITDNEDIITKAFNLMDRINVLEQRRLINFTVDCAIDKEILDLFTEIVLDYNTTDVNDKVSFTEYVDGRLCQIQGEYDEGKRENQKSFK